jgi:hypothetical protein
MEKQEGSPAAPELNFGQIQIISFFLKFPTSFSLLSGNDHQFGVFKGNSNYSTFGFDGRIIPGSNLLFPKFEGRYRRFKIFYFCFSLFIPDFQLLLIFTFSSLTLFCFFCLRDEQ